MKNSFPNTGLFITRLRLENWRNFTHLDIPLQQRVFLVGPNASGKSNLLNAFRFLADIASEGGGLQEAVADRGSVPHLHCLAARSHSDIAVFVRIGTPGDPAKWEYTLRFNAGSDKRAIIKEEKVVGPGGVVVVQRPDPEDRADPERLAQTALQQVSANKAFREVVHFFRSIRYQHIVPQLIRDPDRSVGKKNDPYGGDFLEKLARTPEKEKKERLAIILKALKVAVPQLSKLQPTMDKLGKPHLRGNYDHWRPQGAWQMEEDFSDGTLRLLGLLWAALEEAGPLLLEEPELSLHPEVIRHIPQMLARLVRKTGRQVILSTHAEELFFDDGIGLDEVFLLIPGREGTVVKAAGGIGQIKKLLQSGVPLADSLMAHTMPKDAAQLSLFPDLE